MKHVVVAPPINVVGINSAVPHKIYAAITHGKVYKLHHLGDWMFCAQYNSSSGSTGSYPTMQDAIQAQIALPSDVYEFDTAREFFEWALEQTK